MSKVAVYTRLGCEACTRAKALLTSRGIDFVIVDVSAEAARRNGIQTSSGQPTTLPQVFVGRRRLGGFDALQDLDAAGNLVHATRWCATDGPPIRASAASLESSGGLPAAVRSQLSPRAAAMAGFHYQAGIRPSLRSFLRYAVTRKPAQDQVGNTVLNLAAPPNNDPPPPALPGTSAIELAALLRQAMLQLLDKFADPQTGDVDYLSMRGSAEWSMFRSLAAEFGDPRLQDGLEALDEQDRKAFFINLYNAMIFHGVVTYGKSDGMWYLYCFFITPAVSYQLAGIKLSLDDVEHGILRAQPGYFDGEGQALQRSMRLPTVDPRIHMALNCGSRGCPAVAVYSGGQKLDFELDEAVRSFIADDKNVRVARGASGPGDAIQLALSSLFKMYLEDFAGAGAKPDSPLTGQALARWLLPFSRGTQRNLLEQATAENAPPPKLEWLHYDWKTNGPDVPLDSYIYSPRL
eukprot:TRINITY_DN29104_c0_g1_i1.p1 TRINITY_DN29104_c0_g1~~TRINITY_DN29104_c0_g1_i1.p1  ORF type:complete len:471 (+),score=64.27 TRINITY_DN29104_c0_g1_i1:27-1415(+)